MTAPSKEDVTMATSPNQEKAQLWSFHQIKEKQNNDRTTKSKEGPTMNVLMKGRHSNDRSTKSKKGTTTPIPTNQDKTKQWPLHQIKRKGQQQLLY
jgi:hypothetical protein